ncbi:MAG TPA: hypothetical protein VKG38_13815, partial [Solirubrobacteraceae bacterium]|nr:hypothetical protein [Solirubrobacteraceae bacterium]
HTHGIYDFAHGAIIRNDYIYDNARDGVLLYGGGGGAVVEHNVIDHSRRHGYPGVSRSAAMRSPAVATIWRAMLALAPSTG